MGGKDPSQLAAGENTYLPAMFCPGYGTFSREAPTVAMTRVNYMMTSWYSNSLVSVPVDRMPFGYPPGYEWSSSPVKLSSVNSYEPVSEVFAVSDVDQALWPGNWAGVAQTSTHGMVRNRIYFDWHVKSFKGNNVETVSQ